MASEEKKTRRKSAYSPGRMARAYMFNPLRMKAFRFIRWIIGVLICGLLIFALLSGVINQVRTGESMFNFFMNQGHAIGEWVHDLFTDDSNLKLTEDGIYFKDANPPSDGALPKVDEEGREAIKDENSDKDAVGENSPSNKNTENTNPPPQTNENQNSSNNSDKGGDKK